jgi:hypothetical protein
MNVSLVDVVGLGQLLGDGGDSALAGKIGACASTDRWGRAMRRWWMRSLGVVRAWRWPPLWEDVESSTCGPETYLGTP